MNSLHIVPVNTNFAYTDEQKIMIKIKHKNDYIWIRHDYSTFLNKSIKENNFVNVKNNVLPVHVDPRLDHAGLYYHEGIFKTAYFCENIKTGVSSWIPETLIRNAN